MTGYEIYDEGYEAGYESAMEDLMEAMEYTGDAKAVVNKMKSRLDRNSSYNYGRRMGQLAVKSKKAHDAYDNAKTLKAAVKYQKQYEDYDSRADSAYKDIAATIRRRGPENGEAEYQAGIKHGIKYANKRYHKKANESLFDFDDIDHAYLDDEYDDFDYE